MVYVLSTPIDAQVTRLRKGRAVSWLVLTAAILNYALVVGRVANNTNSLIHVNNTQHSSRHESASQI